VSARKIGLLILIVGFGAAVETAWSVRNRVSIGPHGCRVLGGRFYGPSFTFEQAGERALPPGGAVTVAVTNAFGAVRVTAGGPGAVKVRLRKVVFLPTEEKARVFADGIELRLDDEEGRVRIGTNRTEVGRGGDVGFETHLDVEAPADAAVEVRNEHGRAEVIGLASADVRASFDDVLVERIAGGVTIDARHGAVRVDETGAVLQVTARHGDVEVTGIRGATRVDVEHGAVATKRTGALEIAMKHGDLDAQNVGGDLRVRSEHSWVKARDVVGGADIETSFAGATLLRVGGDVRAKVEHGQLKAEDVGGDVTAETSFDGVELERVAGSVTLAVHHGAVEARAVMKGARVRASGGDVSLDGFAGPVDIEVERGGVRLDPRAPITEAVTASATHGDVHLEVPEGSHIQLDVEARRGEVRTAVPDLEATATTAGEPGRSHRLTARLGGGGAVVRLRADGDVSLEPRATAPVTETAVATPAPGSSPTPAEEALERPTGSATPFPTARPPAKPTEKQTPPAESPDEKR
jgi:DUF4097 and DUF4098 domain-containing protein YvlB